jgi:hypothetical protein
MNQVRCWILNGILLCSTWVAAQEKDSLSTDLSQAFLLSDSLSIFNLIDSLLALDVSPSSQLAFRMGYNSNVLSAGRTLGIENFGLAPGITYFHKSGLFADVTAYYSKDFEPEYYLTVTSIGYMKDLSGYFSFMASFDKYFYNIDNAYIPYSNTFSVTPIFDWKFISVTTTYSFYFGDQYAHRIMPGINFTIEKKRIAKIDRIAIAPSFYALYGNEIITTLEYVLPETIRERLQNRVRYGTPYSLVQHDKNVFGVMNYAISIPLRISLNRWSLSLTYTYNIPKALPGEPIVLTESTFLSGSLGYMLDLRRNKKPLLN